MIQGFTLLLLYQFAGEVLGRALNLPVPGPVLGMGLLFASLLLRDQPFTGLQEAANGLLQHLSLLFIPAGVGVLLHLHRMQDEWLALTAATILGTLAAMAGCAWLLGKLSHRRRERDEP